MADDPVYDGGESTIEARIVRATVAMFGAVPPVGGTPYGALTTIAAVVGVDRQCVSSALLRARRGHVVKGRMTPLQPGGLPARLLALERERPGLSRGKQARILGTSTGMVRDTAYRLRKAGFLESPAKPW